MKPTKTLILLALFLSLFSYSPSAQMTEQEEKARWEQIFSLPKAPSDRTEIIKGRVVGVHDGDTCTVLDSNNKQYKIRFDGIDAPELKQDFGQRAKQNLSDLIFGKQVTVISSKSDKYGRTVGKVLVDGVDANLNQIKSGFAWHYKKYQDEQTPEDRNAYSAAEIASREAKLGIWSQPNILPPWDYRSSKKESQEFERANRKYEMGTKGGCFYINSSGKKTYVDKEKCGSGSTPPPPQTNKAGDLPGGSSNRNYIKGEKGGCYYINGAGKKSYVEKEKCGQ